MLRLNNDCLLHIFQFVGIKDQLSLVEVCQTFRDLIIYFIWRTTYKDFHPDFYGNTLTEMQLQKFITYLAPYIKLLTIGSRPSFSFYLTLSFPLLITLNYRRYLLKDEHLKLLYENSPKLEVLFLHSKDITGYNFEKLNNLKELHVPYCSISTHQLCAIMKNLYLIVLDITDNPLNFNIVLETLRDQNFPLNNSVNTLEKLYCSGKDLRHLKSYKNLNIFTKLQFLRIDFLTVDEHVDWNRFFKLKGDTVYEIKVKFYNINNIGYNFFKYARMSQNLQTLYIMQNFGDCSSEEYNVIVRFLDKCTSLRRIYIRCCRLYFIFWKPWIHEIIRCLERQERAEKLTLIVKEYFKGQYNEAIKRVKKSEAYRLQNVLELELETTFNDHESHSNSVFVECKFSK